MADEKELTITRTFNAPREVVWKAWTDPDMFMQWWGPRDFTTLVSKIDLKVGGEYFSCMRSPDGQDFCSKGVYRKIVELECLVMTDSFADNEGNAVPATHYGMGADFPMEMQIMVTFKEQNGKTKLIVKHSDIRKLSEAELNDMQQGWNESLDKLAELLTRS
ncbi:SRPBCC family protein [Methanobacterium sp.]|uniref:SRPBCC family protein n=1 Tax=Methanobacterium sp. TaxID=2164 RepID=UPI003C70F752